MAAQLNQRKERNKLLIHGWIRKHRNDVIVEIMNLCFSYYHIDFLDCTYDEILNEWNLSEMIEMMKMTGYAQPKEWLKLIDKNILMYEIGCTPQQTQMFINKLCDEHNMTLELYTEYKEYKRQQYNHYMSTRPHPPNQKWWRD